jgi:hypothetical protein
MRKFIEKNFVLIVFVISLLSLMKSCGESRELTKIKKEIKAIKDAGGIVIRVIRGPEPEWYNLAKIVNQGPNNIEWRLSKDRLEKFNVHASETAWVGTEFDAIIDNNADGLDNLYKQIKSLVQDPRAAKLTSSS